MTHAGEERRPTGTKIPVVSAIAGPVAIYADVVGEETRVENACAGRQDPCRPPRSKLPSMKMKHNPSPEIPVRAYITASRPAGPDTAQAGAPHAERRKSPRLVADRARTLPHPSIRIIH